MPFEASYIYEFDRSGETKPVQQDFQKKTIRADVTHGRHKGADVYTLEWAVVRKTKLDTKDAIVIEDKSEWLLYPTKMMHATSKKLWEPDLMYREWYFKSIVGIGTGEIQLESGGEFLIDLFDHTEVDLLGEEKSIFATHFPKFYSYRQTVIRKKKEKVINTAMKS